LAEVLGLAVGGSRPAAVIGNATLPSQRSVSGTLDRIARLAADAGIEAPATLVVGDVVAARRVLEVVREEKAGTPAESRPKQILVAR
jgi:siroheme synthase